MSVSRAGKAPQVLVVGRLIDAFDEEIASVAAATVRSYLPVMRIKRFPAGFVIPAQPVMASRPPSGADWVHEIKHDGYRLIVRRDGPTVRLYTRNAYDWTVRLPAIAAAAARIKAKSFTIDGEAVRAGARRFVTLR
jgi:bifunctional non-homologous end joining protein LigD